MKKSSNEWCDSISVTPHTEGQYSWFTAYCPLCSFTEKADVDGSNSIAEIAAKGKIAGHIRSDHAENLTDPPVKTEADKKMDELRKEIFGDGK